VSELKKGDLVRRIERNGTSTGIVYRIVSEPDVARDKEGKQKTVFSKTTGTRCSSLVFSARPELVLFETSSKKHVHTSTVQFACVDVKKVGLVELGAEYLKFTNFINEEAKRLSGET